MRPYPDEMRPVWAIYTKSGQKCCIIDKKNSIILIFSKIPEYTVCNLNAFYVFVVVDDDVKIDASSYLNSSPPGLKIIL